jgi:signal transduction histidine kinase
MESEQMVLKKEKVNVSDLVQNILSGYFKDRIEKKQLSFDIEPDVFFMTDTVIFPSLIINLVENAVKYSFDAVNVVVRLKKSGPLAILSVSDQGCGISDNEKAYVFDRFYRVGSEEVRSTKGTGIGLYLVKQIADAHGATIRIEDNQPKGTVFIISFNA